MEELFYIVRIFDTCQSGKKRGYWRKDGPLREELNNRKKKGKRGHGAYSRKGLMGVREWRGAGKN